MASHRCLLATPDGCPPTVEQLTTGLLRQQLVERPGRLSLGGQRVVMLSVRQLLPLLSPDSLRQLVTSVMATERGLLHLGESYTRSLDNYGRRSQGGVPTCLFRNAPSFLLISFFLEIFCRFYKKKFCHLLGKVS